MCGGSSFFGGITSVSVDLTTHGLFVKAATMTGIVFKEKPSTTHAITRCVVHSAEDDLGSTWGTTTDGFSPLVSGF